MKTRALPLRKHAVTCGDYTASIEAHDVQTAAEVAADMFEHELEICHWPLTFTVDGVEVVVERRYAYFARTK